MTRTAGPTARRPWRWLVAITLGLVVALAAGVAWVVRTADRTWDRLDSAADDFEVPSGFTQVARVRQGTAFCWVTCTNGGEANVTLVFETDARTPEEACRKLHQPVVELTGDATKPEFTETCGWRGDLAGNSSVYAAAGPHASFGPQSGFRWTEEVEAPDTPVVAYVEFASGLD